MHNPHPLPFPAETLLDALIESIICIDLDGRIVYWSRGAERIYEYTADEALGRQYAMLFPGGAAEEAETLRQHGPGILAEQRRIFEGWRLTKSGRRVYVRVAASPLFGETGQHVGFVGHAIDITAQKLAEEALVANRTGTETQSARYAALLDAQSRADIGLFVIEEGRIVFANDALCRLFGYNLEELLALPSYLLLAHPDDRERVAQNHQRRLQGEEFSNRYDIAIITKSGERREVEITASTISSGGKPGILVVVIDHTDRRLAEERVQYLALHDALTGLANRVLFFDRLNAAIATARRKSGAFALLFLDLDDFKPINDTYGHQAGDIALRTVAERLRDCVRESDTLARLGGDEFILLVNDTHEESAAITVAEKAIAALSHPLPIEGCTDLLGGSIGIALYPRHGEDADSLMRHADAAMYGAKRLGKNRYLLPK
jgi:diguanylate cyclase (GGDEF)-like protein/PAS domain S-box-containing protein